MKKCKRTQKVLLETSIKPYIENIKKILEKKKMKESDMIKELRNEFNKLSRTQEYIDNIECQITKCKKETLEVIKTYHEYNKKNRNKELFKYSKEILKRNNITVEELIEYEKLERFK